MKINFFGDVMLGRGVANVVSNSQNILKHFKKTENDDHINICNLEAPIIIDEPNNKNKFFISPNALSILDFFNGVSIANNHIFDQGEIGLINTIETLKQRGIKHTGAGINKEEAFSPIIIRKDKGNIIILGLTSINNISVPDRSLAEKIALIEDRSLIDEFIVKYKKPMNTLVVMPHMGIEHVDAPSNYIVNKYRSLVDMGFDLIIGSHPHTVQGIEWYKKGLICYSLGDFIFDNLNKMRRKSLVVNIEFKSSNEWDTRFRLSIKNEDFQPKLLSSEVTKRYLKRVNRYIDNKYFYNSRFVSGKLYNQIYFICFETKVNGFKGFRKAILSKLSLILSR